MGRFMGELGMMYVLFEFDEAPEAGVRLLAFMGMSD